MSELALLLDEHFSPRLAAQLRGGGADAVAVAERPDLLGGADNDILLAAKGEGRVVVTQDVRTFGLACRAVPDHVGVIFVAPGAFRRTRDGEAQIAAALLALLAEPPAGLGSWAVQWWLTRST